MRNLPLSESRRKRSADVGASASSPEGGAGIVPTVIALVLVLVLAVCMIAPGKVDDALDRTGSIVAGKDAVTTQVWQTVATTFEGDDAESEQVASAALASGATSLKPSEVATKPNEIATGDSSRTLLTRGHDILELDPYTTIDISDEAMEDSTTIIRLFDGTIHVKAAKRTDGGTLSVKTRYLVATVKGTKFDVTTTAEGAAVSVTEGIVGVRSTASNDGVDVTRGRTAVILAADGATLRVISTPAGGAMAAIEAMTSGTVSNANHGWR